MTGRVPGARLRVAGAIERGRGREGGREDREGGWDGGGGGRAVTSGFPGGRDFVAEQAIASFSFFPTASEYFLGFVNCVAGS